MQIPCGRNKFEQKGEIQISKTLQVPEETLCFNQNKKRIPLDSFTFKRTTLVAPRKTTTKGERKEAEPRQKGIPEIEAGENVNFAQIGRGKDSSKQSDSRHIWKGESTGLTD